MEKIKSPEKTGYKVIDAILYAFDYLFNTSRRDIKAFALTSFLLIAIVGWGLFVRQVANAKSNEEAIRKDERELCKVEVVQLRGEIESLKESFLSLENEYLLNPSLASAGLKHSD